MIYLAVPERRPKFARFLFFRPMLLGIERLHPDGSSPRSRPPQNPTHSPPLCTRWPRRSIHSFITTPAASRPTTTSSTATYQLIQQSFPRLLQPVLSSPALSLSPVQDTRAPTHTHLTHNHPYSYTPVPRFYLIRASKKVPSTPTYCTYLHTLKPITCTSHTTPRRDHQAERTKTKTWEPGPRSVLCARARARVGAELS